jgi:hypothetical protein
MEMKTRTNGLRFAFMALLVALVLLCSTGCFQRTIYVPDGTAVRLRAPIKNAKVWVMDQNGKPVPGELDLPEGWYCLPLNKDHTVIEVPAEPQPAPKVMPQSLTMRE